MENTPQTTKDDQPKAPAMTKDQAEAWGIFMTNAQPTLERLLQHFAASEKASAMAAIPANIIAGIVAIAVATGAIIAITNGNEQLAKELLLPLITFAGGLGIGRSNH